MVEKTEDLNLPNAVISRIVKESLPAGTIVSKEARSAIARAASVFVLYATSTSVSVAQKSKKKTLSAQDVLTALEEMDFQTFVPQLEECLEAYRKSQQTKKDAKKAKKAEGEKSPTKEAEGVDESMETEEIAEDDKENGVENGEEAPAD